jgi:uncharacterized protein YraI
MTMLAAGLLAGCGLFGGAQESPTPMPTRTPFPTFTATPAAPPTPAAAAATVAATAAALPPVTVADTQAVPAASTVTGTMTGTMTEMMTGTMTGTITGEAASGVAGTITNAAAGSAAANTAEGSAAGATLTITSDLVNVRSGPGTEYGLIGSAANGESFGVVAKTAAGDWWLVCCVGGQNGWVFGELAAVQGGESVPVTAEIAAVPAESAPAVGAEAGAVATAPGTGTGTAPGTAPGTATETPAGTAAEAATATPAPAEVPAEAPAAPLAAYDPTASSAGNFDPNAQYQIVQFRVLGLDENNGGIRDSGAQHLIFLTVLDQNGNGVDGAVVRNLVGDKSEVVTGNKGPGKTEITMYYEPFKLAVASDPAGPVTSQVSNQMGLIFPHLPDIVGKLGDVNYEYGACPTIDIKCQWPLSAIHFSYEITFQKVK